MTAIVDHEGQVEQNHQASCRLLRLPPELRNLIYELAFTTQEAEPIELLDSSPPSKSLLLSCREIYQECHLLYTDAYRRYWKDSTFMINNVAVENFSARISKLNGQDLSHVRRLELNSRTREVGEKVGEHQATYEDGIWTIVDMLGRGPRQRQAVILDSRARRNQLAALLKAKVPCYYSRGGQLTTLSRESYYVLGGLSEDDAEKTKVWADGQGLSLEELAGVMTWYFPGQ